MLIRDGRSGTCQIENPRDVQRDWQNDVVTDDLKARMADQVSDILTPPGKETVKAEELEMPALI